MKTYNYADKTILLAKSNKLLKAKDLANMGIPRIILTRLTRKG